MTITFWARESNFQYGIEFGVSEIEAENKQTERMPDLTGQASAPSLKGMENLNPPSNFILKVWDPDQVYEIPCSCATRQVWLSARR